MWMRKDKRMRKVLILLTMVFVVLVLMQTAIANDADDLKKLQPLTTGEQPYYDKVKNNVPELKKFIATRTYLRTVEDIIGEDWDTKDIEPYLPKLPKPNRNVVMDYTIDLVEDILLFNIMEHQRKNRRSATSDPDDMVP
jgi:hypothetical protein